MKKKAFVLAGVAAVLAGSMFLPPVQAAAESALSIFRVNDAKTIKITVADIQSMMDYAQANGMMDKAAGVDAQSADSQQSMMAAAQSKLHPLDSARAFTAFDLKLPQSLKSETPKLYAVDSQSQSVTLDTTEINAELAKMKLPALDSGLNGAKLTVVTPPVAVAEYAGVVFVATQNVHIDAPDKTVNALWSEIVNAPMIPSDLRSQLAAVDPTSGDIYLPVIEGLGRQTAIGGITGYLYSASDLARVAAMFPGVSQSGELTKLQGGNASVLIWVKDGVLYLVGGQQSDSQLAAIARSVR